MKWSNKILFFFFYKIINSFWWFHLPWFLSFSFFFFSFIDWTPWAVTTPNQSYGLFLFKQKILTLLIPLFSFTFNDFLLWLINSSKYLQVIFLFLTFKEILFLFSVFSLNTFYVFHQSTQCLIIFFFLQNTMNYLCEKQQKVIFFLGKSKIRNKNQIKIT